MVQCDEWGQDNLIDELSLLIQICIEQTIFLRIIKRAKVKKTF